MIKVVTIAGISTKESTDFSTFKITNGSGTVVRAGATVQNGVTAHVQVEFKMKSVTDHDFKTWFEQTKSFFSNEQWHTLQERHSAGGFLGGVLCGCFGLLFGGGSYEHYKNTYDKQVTVNDTEKQGFLKQLHDIVQTDVVVTGTIDVTGTGNMPISGWIFVETTSIEFKDGTTLTVINTSNPVVAQADGNKEGLAQPPANQKLTVVPIPH